MKSKVHTLDMKLSPYLQLPAVSNTEQGIETDKDSGLYVLPLVVVSNQTIHE